MKNFKKLMMISMMSLTTQQFMFASDDVALYSADQVSESDQKQPSSHQGWGRVGTFFGDALTLHPVQAMNAGITGDAPQTTFGYHHDEDGKLQANEANTKRNRQRNREQEAKQRNAKKNKYSNKQSKKRYEQPKPEVASFDVNDQQVVAA